MTRRIDVRVIAATNRDLQAEVAQKTFREDLYFRLNVFPIHSPPLKDRLEDIGQLASLFVRRVCAQMNKPELPVSLADVERMKRYSWPGNIRELQNLIERAVILSTKGRLRLDIPEMPTLDPAHGEDPEVSTPRPIDAAASGTVLNETANRLSQRDNLVRALRECGGKVSGAGGAAELLGLKPTTLYSRIKRHGIDARQFKGRPAS